MKSIALLLLFHVTGTLLYGQSLHWKVSPQAAVQDKMLIFHSRFSLQALGTGSDTERPAE